MTVSHYLFKLRPLHAFGVYLWGKTPYLVDDFGNLVPVTPGSHYRSGNGLPH